MDYNGKIKFEIGLSEWEGLSKRKQNRLSSLMFEYFGLEIEDILNGKADSPLSNDQWFVEDWYGSLEEDGVLPCGCCECCGCVCDEVEDWDDKNGWT